MKKILFAAAALSALAAAPAMAQTASVNITGTILPACSGVADNSIANVLTSSTTAPGTITNTTANGPTVGILCNGAGTTVTVQAGALSGPAVPGGETGPAWAAGFRNTVNYTASLNIVGAGFTQATALPTDSSTMSGAGTPVTVGLTNGNFRLELTNIAAAGTLIAGDYSGVTTIVVNPL
jgi:hypothetical protein